MHGSPDVLVATCLGEGGGLFRRDADRWRRIDHLACTGLAVAPGRNRVARVLWTSDDPQTRAELIESDATGVLRYLRVDALKEPHGLRYDHEHIVAVSTLENRVLWIDEAGRVTSDRGFEGNGDAWHLNCLNWMDDRLIVSAFGRHPDHRDWAGTRLRGNGVIVDVASGEVLVSGLSAPHDPTFQDDGWLVCDSATGRLLRLNRTGDVTAEVDLGGWTRGLAIEGDRVHVGSSARREDSGGPRQATVTTLRLDDLAMLDRAELAAEEIFALELVPAHLVAGMEVGFSTNPARTTPLAPAGTELAAPAQTVDEPVVELAASVLTPVRAGRFFDVRVTVTTREEHTLHPTGDRSWRIGARWRIGGDAYRDDGPRAGLAAPMLPGTSADVLVRVFAPDDLSGSQGLELRLVQHDRWHGSAATELKVVAEPA